MFFSLFSADGDMPVKGSQSNHKKLGTAGLALHYANIITQIDTLVSLMHMLLKFFMALLYCVIVFFFCLILTLQMRKEDEAMFNGILKPL